MFRTTVIPHVAIAASSLACIVAGAEPDPVTHAILQARAYKYQVRVGRYERAQDSLAVLRTAVEAAPDNIEVWNELGTAYFMQITAAANGKSDARVAASAAQDAFEAFDRAVRLDPSNAYATAGRGMARTVIANRSRAPEDLRRAIVDLNRGVELAPSQVPVRLMRAFSSLALPLPLRHDLPIEDDLMFLMNVADGTRAGDVVALLLADLQWESGRRDEARSTYERMARRDTPAAQRARERLAVLSGNQSPPTADMMKLRLNIGRDCTQCHGH